MAAHPPDAAGQACPGVQVLAAGRKAPNRRSDKFEIGVGRESQLAICRSVIDEAVATGRRNTTVEPTGNLLNPVAG